MRLYLTVYKTSKDDVLCLNLHASTVQMYFRKKPFSHLEDVAERHSPVREAMDEQCFQESLHVVEGVTHTRQTIATKTLDYTPISPLLYFT